MRVLTLTNAYPPHYYGGYELTCHDVMRRWAAVGHDITVLTSSIRVPGVPDIAEAQVRRELLTYWDWERNGPILPRSPVARMRIEQHNLRELDQAIAAAQPDVVSVWHLGGLSLSLLTVIEQRGLPVVLTIANEWLERGVALDGWARLWRRLPARPRSLGGVPTRLPALTSATFDFVSDFTKQRSMSAKLPWRFADAPVVSPGIDLDDFPIDDARPRADWSWRVLYVGRIDRPKGVETLIRGFAMLPPTAHLQLVGGGDLGYQHELRAVAAELGVADRVTMHSLPRDRVRERYVDSDVLVFPSEWEEPFGLVPLEAMACARPVVATGRGGSGEYLRDGGNCLLYGAGDPAALAAAVQTLASDPTLRRTLVDGGLATAREYTTDGYAAALLRLHEQAARRNGRS